MRLLGRALLLAPLAAVALAHGGEALAAQPIWATNTQQSQEHCDPQTSLPPGGILLPGAGLYSANGRYYFVMQTDGNLVLYLGSRALWATGTNGQPVQRAIMQEDGNLVLYDHQGQPKWASGTHGNPGAYLLVQCDGNVVIYK